MSEIIGRNIELGVGVEDTRGTAYSEAERWAKKISATVVERSEKISDESTRNVLEDSLGARIVRQWIEGDLEGNVHAALVGYFLYNLYGSITTTNPTGSVYQHVFAVDQSITHPSLSLYAKDGDVQQLAYQNAMISAFSLTASIDSYVTFTASFMAKDSTSNSDTPSYETTDYDFVGRDITVKFADTEGALSGATATKVKDLTINMETGLIADHILGQYAPDDIYNAMMMIEGEFTLNFDDTTFKALYLNENYKYMEITIANTDVDLGGGNNPTLKFLFNRVQIMDWNREDSANDLSTSPVSFKAFYNATDGEQSEVTLINTVSEYDTPLS